VPRLAQHMPGPFVALHPATAREQGICEGDLVSIKSRHGEVLLPVRLEPGQRRGEVFVPIHWNARFASQARISDLMGARVDPLSGQPESKVEAVMLQLQPMQQWLVLLGTDEVPAAMLEAHGVAYWERRPVNGGWCYRMALPEALNEAGLQHFKLLFGRNSVLEFHDAAAHDHRLVFLDDQKLQGLIFTTARPQALPAAQWLQSLLVSELPEDEWLLMAGRDLEASSKGELICSCHETGKDEIMAAIQQGCADVQSLGRQLRCGTGCGSCIPELKALLRSSTELKSPGPNSSADSGIPAPVC
jgi:assimilatory nitrate reductase catalytic subunit